MEQNATAKALTTKADGASKPAWTAPRLLIVTVGENTQNGITPISDASFTGMHTS
jgi:hypothetical protein